MNLSRRHRFEATLGLGAAALMTRPETVVAETTAGRVAPAVEAVASYRASTENHSVPIINPDRLGDQAKGILTDFAYALVSGGAGDEWTLRENRRAFEDFPIMTRRLAGVDQKTIDLRVKIQGRNAAGNPRAIGRFQAARHDRVLSTGTLLDSLRFRVYLARRLGVNPASVEAQVVGEHGTSEVLLWSSARVGGVPVAEALPRGNSMGDLREAVERDVRYANITIIEGNEASQLGIGIVSARIAEAVLRDERVVLPIGAYNAGYGVTLSLPSVVGREGVSRILEPAMSDEERRSLGQSAEVLRQAAQRVFEL
jgi:hypothetical protein